MGWIPQDRNGFQHFRHTSVVFIVLCVIFIELSHGNVADAEQRDYLNEMSLMEMIEVFGVNHPDNAPTYYPARVDGLDEIDHSGVHDQLFKVHTLGKTLNLKVRKNTINFPEHHVTEYHDEHGPTETYTGLGVGLFTRGEVENDELSRAHLHHSGKGISGSIHTYNDAFIIKPLPLRMQNEKANHVVYRLADSPAQESMARYNKYISEKFGQQKKRSASAKGKQKIRKTMEVMMVADWKMLEFYTRELLEQYMLDLTNVIAGLYHDPLLEYKLDFVLVRKVIWTTDKLQASDTTELLAKFQKWFKKWNIPDDSNPKHADIGVLANKNGCTPSGCDIEGLAYMQSCTAHSVATCVDRGLEGATSFAHEVGHTLGVGHDETKTCPTATFIMSADGGRGGEKALEFSPCASHLIAQTLKRETCFDDAPSHSLTTRNAKFQLYGQKFDKAHQCDSLYGHKYELCPFRKNTCQTLYCSEKGKRSCKTRYFPMLHGTKCGVGMWCIYGECVPDGSPIPKPPSVIDGSWGAWSEFTKCSKPCGVGIQWRSRKCDSPEPQNGGKWCDPWSKSRKPERGQYQVCNVQNCKKGRKTLRTGTLFGSPMKDRIKQCKRLGYNTAAKLKFTGKCERVCGPNRFGGSFLGHVDEGTPCVLKHMKMKKRRPGFKPALGVCVHGDCKEYGCDMKLHSDVENDRCGICGGNGTTCEPYKKFFRKQWYPPFSNLKKVKKLFTIPKGAIDAVAIVRRPSWIYLGFGFAKKNKVKLIGRSRKRIFKNQRKGLKIRLRMGLRNRGLIRIIGTVPEDIDIYMKNPYRRKCPGIMVKYLKALDEPAALPATKWKAMNWEACSHTCGGDGTQKRHVYCLRKDDKTAVHPGACQSKRPPTSRPCNRKDCPAIWMVSKWTPCSKTCATGRKNRNITCEAINSKGAQTVVADSKCAAAKPNIPATKTCNVIQCPARWEVKSEWTPCSRSCGGGDTRRSVECWMMSETGVDEKVSDLSCGHAVIERPLSERECNKDEPCPHWNIEKTPCSVSCGNGTQKASVVCENEVRVFPESNCNADIKPELDNATVSCNLGPCMPGVWVKKEGICSKSCGGGELSISLSCQSDASGNSTVLPDSECDANRKPLVMWGSCNIDECPIETVWRLRYSECSVTCGAGNVTAEPVCENESTKRKLDDDDCDFQKKPSRIVKPCNLIPCNQLISQLEYHWARRWQDCPKTCGPATEATKNVCIRKYGNKDVDPYYCRDQTPPQNLTRPCNYGICPPHDNVTYLWHMKDLGCGSKCGEGTHEVEIACVRRQPFRPLAYTNFERCNPNEKPQDPEKKCEFLPPCPSRYELKLHHGICDALCGVGHKIRMMSCEEDKSAVGFDNCTSLVTKDILRPRTCHAKRKCTKVYPTQQMPAVASMGCWEDDDSEELPPVVGKSPKEAEEDASDKNDLRMRTCGLLALRKFEMIWGVDNKGNCFFTEKAKDYMKKKDFKSKCALSAGPKKKYLVYKFYIWN